MGECSEVIYSLSLSFYARVMDQGVKERENSHAMLSADRYSNKHSPVMHSLESQSGLEV